MEMGYFSQSYEISRFENANSLFWKMSFFRNQMIDIYCRYTKIFIFNVISNFSPFLKFRYCNFFCEWINFIQELYIILDIYYFEFVTISGSNRSLDIEIQLILFLENVTLYIIVFNFGFSLIDSCTHKYNIQISKEIKLSSLHFLNDQIVISLNYAWLIIQFASASSDNNIYPTFLQFPWIFGNQ